MANSDSPIRKVGKEGVANCPVVATEVLSKRLPN